MEIANSNSSVDFQEPYDSVTCFTSRSNLPLSNKYLEDIEITKRKRNPNLILPVILCLSISFGGFIFGWDTGTIGGIANMSSFQHAFGNQIDQKTNLRSLSNLQVGWLIGIFNIGCAIGGLTLARIGDWLGRKKGIFIAVLVYLVGVAFQLGDSHKWRLFLSCRFISGLGVGSLTVLVPMFLSETAPTSIRGAMVVLYQLMVTLGILAGNITNKLVVSRYAGTINAKEWGFPIGLGFIWSMVTMVGIAFTPESTHYFAIVKKDFDNAKSSYAFLNDLNINDDRVSIYVSELMIRPNSDDENTVSSTSEIGHHEKKSNKWAFIKGKPKLGYRLFIGIIIMMAQQLSGVNYFFYYGTTVFKMAGIQDSYTASIILSSVNFIATFGGIYLVEKLGRKACLFYGAIGTMLCMTIYASVGGFALGSPAAGPVMLAFTCIYIIFFAVTLGPVSFVVVSELYPTKTKYISMAICGFVSWMTNFSISLLTLPITSKIGFLYGFVFAGCLGAYSIFVWFIVPETKGKSESEVNEIYESIDDNSTCEKR